MGGAYDITGSRVSISFYGLAFTIEEREDGDEEEEKNEIHLSKALKSVDIFFMKLKNGRFFVFVIGDKSKIHFFFVFFHEKTKKRGKR